MSTEVKTDDKTTLDKILKGLQIRTFNGEIDKTPEEKNKDKKTIIKFLYDRIVLPWSRTGKDSDDKDVAGSVPSLAEVMAYSQQMGFPVEFKLDGEGNPEGACFVGFAIDGMNAYFNRTARVKAENTPESALDKLIQGFMSKTGLNKEQATAMVQKMLAEVK